MSLSGHKFHGPEGAGALFLRRGTRISPQLPGTQQSGWRGGTENVPGIVGAGVAARIALAELPVTIRRCTELRDQLSDGLRRRLPNVVPHGAAAPRLCNTLSLGLPGLRGHDVVAALSRAASASPPAAPASATLPCPATSCWPCRSRPPWPAARSASASPA